MIVIGERLVATSQDINSIDSRITREVKSLELEIEKLSAKITEETKKTLALIAEYDDKLDDKITDSLPGSIIMQNQERIEMLEKGQEELKERLNPVDHKITLDEEIHNANDSYHSNCLLFQQRVKEVTGEAYPIKEAVYNGKIINAFIFENSKTGNNLYVYMLPYSTEKKTMTVDFMMQDGEGNDMIDINGNDLNEFFSDQPFEEEVQFLRFILKWLF